MAGTGEHFHSLQMLGADDYEEIIALAQELVEENGRTGKYATNVISSGYHGCTCCDLDNGSQHSRAGATKGQGVGGKP